MQIYLYSNSMTVSSTDKVTDAQTILHTNSQGDWTYAAPRLYPHQWLWDSCFIAIGISTYNSLRAANELLSLRRGQWANGMLPHIIFSDAPDYWLGPEFWQSHKAPYAPRHIETSGITQPPVLAIAAKTIADRLDSTRRKRFLEEIYPVIIKYHTWLFTERIHQGTLLQLIHPWESGLDNTPPWMYLLKQYHTSPHSITPPGALQHVYPVRKDLRVVAKNQRPTNGDIHRMVDLALMYRLADYQSKHILNKPLIAVEDLTFNVLAVRASDALEEIAAYLGVSLPPIIKKGHKQLINIFPELWDAKAGEFFSRDSKTKKLISQTSIATFLPLYAGLATEEQAATLVKQLKNTDTYGAPYPVPTTSMASSYFSEERYWQGPIWVNMNWLILQGLEKYGFYREAKDLRTKTIQLIESKGFYEYFSPLTGAPAGAGNFSWTAALYLELLSNN